MGKGQSRGATEVRRGAHTCSGVKSSRLLISQPTVCSQRIFRNRSRRKSGPHMAAAFCRAQQAHKNPFLEGGSPRNAFCRHATPSSVSILRRSGIYGPNGPFLLWPWRFAMRSHADPGPSITIQSYWRRSDVQQKPDETKQQRLIVHAFSRSSLTKQSS